MNNPELMAELLARNGAGPLVPSNLEALGLVDSLSCDDCGDIVGMIAPSGGGEPRMVPAHLIKPFDQVTVFCVECLPHHQRPRTRVG